MSVVRSIHPMVHGHKRRDSAHLPQRQLADGGEIEVDRQQLQNAQKPSECRRRKVLHVSSPDRSKPQHVVAACYAVGTAQVWDLPDAHQAHMHDLCIWRKTELDLGLMSGHRSCTFGKHIVDRTYVQHSPKSAAAFTSGTVRPT